MAKNIEKIIEDSIESVLIDHIVEKVLEKLVEQDKKALLVFTGATIGFKQSIQSMKKLKEEGWKLEVVLSKAASDVLTDSLIKEILEIDCIIEEETADVHKLVDDNSLIIIPTLTINSCSKIVNCISDNVPTNIVSYGLMKGKDIIASINGCCPDNIERISLFGNNLTSKRKEILRNNIVSLKEQGVIVTTSENIGYKVNKVFNHRYSLFNDTKSTKVETTQVINKKENNDEIILDKKIISRMDIYENRSNKIIKVNSKSIITDLAREEALRLKINLLKIE